MFLGSYVGARGESVVAVDITRVPEAGVPGVGGIAGVGGAVGGVLGTQDSGTVDGALGKNGISGGAAAGIRQPGNAKGNGGVAAAKIAGRSVYRIRPGKVRTMPSMIRSARPYSPWPRSPRCCNRP